MAKYFFHVTGKTAAEDDEGQEFATPQAAAEEARLAAREIARNYSEQEMRNSTVRVVDEGGSEVARFTIF
jgi:hypothetical protein